MNLVFAYWPGLTEWTGRIQTTVSYVVFKIKRQLLNLYLFKTQHPTLKQINGNIWEVRINFPDRPVFIRFRRPRGPFKMVKHVLENGKNISLKTIPYCNNDGSPLKIIPIEEIFGS
jgi:hypothetical protein